MKRYLSVCASGDDLALIRTVAHSTEHGIGKDDLASYKPPAKGDRQAVSDSGQGGLGGWDSRQVPDDAGTITAGRHTLGARNYIQ